jgi:hypothetical protein
MSEEGGVMPSDVAKGLSALAGTDAAQLGTLSPESW